MVEVDIEKKVDELKQKGNEFFAKGKPDQAVKIYTQGLELDKENNILYSNRAAAYLKLKNFKKALKDAKKCVSIAPTWGKGYIRLAQAQIGVGKLDECEETIEELSKVEPDNRNIKVLSDSVKQKRIFQKLEGKWYGKVSPELGGYLQVFDFKSETEVIVEIFGRAISSKLSLDVTQDPPFLDLLVESEDGQPAAPEVKHIFKLDDYDVLHLCSPYMTSPEIRPTKFEGPAYVKMKRGEPPVDSESANLKKEIGQLSVLQKCEKFAQSIIDILPKSLVNPELTGVLPSQDETQRAQMMLDNVKFQTAYYEIKNLYGDAIEEQLRLYLEKSAPCPTEQLKNKVDEMRKKMQEAGLFPSDEQLEQLRAAQENGGTYVQQTPAATPIETTSPVKKLEEEKEMALKNTKQSDTVTPTNTPTNNIETTTKKSTEKEKELDKVEKDPTTLILTVGVLAVASALIAAYVVKKSSK